MGGLAGALKNSSNRVEDGNKYIENEWPKYERNLENFLAFSSSSFLVGTEFSAADVLWFTTITGLRAMGMELRVSSKLQIMLDAFSKLKGVQAFFNEPQKNLFLSNN